MSPGGLVWDTIETEVPELYGSLFEELARLDPAGRWLARARTW